MPSPIQVPELPDAERTALVERLVVRITVPAQEDQRQAATIQQPHDEIAVRKAGGPPVRVALGPAIGKTLVLQ